MKPTRDDLLHDANYGLVEAQGRLHAASRHGDPYGRLDSASALLSQASRLIAAEFFDKAPHSRPAILPGRPRLRIVK